VQVKSKWSSRVPLWLVSLTLWLCSAAQAAPLNVYIGHGQMPFAGGTAEAPGIFTELMQELCSRSAQDCRFRSVPWRRLQKEVAADPRAIVLNLARTEERESDFFWLLEVLPQNYVLNSIQRPFDSLAEALAAGSVVVMGGTPRSVEAQAQAKQGQRVVEVNEPHLAARMLFNSRVVAWYEIDLRSHYLWQVLGQQSQPLLDGETIRQLSSYIASNPALAEAPALRLDFTKGFAAMQVDGSWQRILERYLGHEKSAALVAPLAEQSL
jgi:polar amino acid transport system substrate-binding protein